MDVEDCCALCSAKKAKARATPTCSINLHAMTINSNLHALTINLHALTINLHALTIHSDAHLLSGVGVALLVAEPVVALWWHRCWDPHQIPISRLYLGYISAISRRRTCGGIDAGIPTR